MARALLAFRSCEDRTLDCDFVNNGKFYRPFPLTLAPDRQVGISGMGDEKILKRFNLQVVKKWRGEKTRMGDGYAFLLNAFYWRGDGKTMFSPILEVTTIQNGGALEERVYKPTHCLQTSPLFPQQVWALRMRRSQIWEE
ncbi:MAG: hypothetical protein O7D30_06420 [Rickettsia endosymbiont of Ixodes persulcatus]|nr:hypothetical protein [Rickettsia endosymbiont of Ixodes persulcatus]